MNDKSFYKFVSAFDLFCIWLVLTSAAAFGLLCLGLFSGLHSIGVGLVAFLLVIGILRFKYEFKFVFKSEEFKIELLVILLIASFFRSSPSLFVTGGQDQGVYVIASAFMSRTGTTSLVDSVREEFRGVDLAEYYDLFNRVHDKMDTVRGKYGGIARPGVYFRAEGSSDLLFQFYHLHPAWLAIFGEIFGDSNRVYSLTLFSLLSIAFLYLIAFELTGGKRLPSFLTGFLIAINPAHVYFSNYPLTEIMALALTTGGVYFLLRAYRVRGGGASFVCYLILSLGLFCCYFLTRISGFIWMPFFFSIWMVAAIFEESAIKFKWWSVFSLGILASYGSSIAYGYFYSFPYFYELHRSLFGFMKTIDISVWLPFMALSLILIVSLGLMMRRMARANANLQFRLVRLCKETVFLLAVLALIANAYQAYSLWEFPGSDSANSDRANWLKGLTALESMKTSSLAVIIDLLTPLFFLAFVVSLRDFARRRSLLFGFVLFIIAFSWFYAGYHQDFVAFQYYCLRYQIMELIPYTILVGSVFLSGWIEAGKWKAGVAVFSLVWLSVQSLQRNFNQIKSSEMNGLASSLRQVVNRVDKNDLLLILKPASPFMDVVASLRYYFDRSVAVINDPLDIPLALSPLILNRKDNTRVFTPIPLELTRLPFLKLSGHFDLAASRLEATRWAPRNYVNLHQDWYLYDIDRKSLEERLVYWPKTTSDRWILDGDGRSLAFNFAQGMYRGNISEGIAIELANRNNPICENISDVDLRLGRGRVMGFSDNKKGEFLFPFESFGRPFNKIEIKNLTQEHLQCIGKIHIRNISYQLFPAVYPHRIGMAQFHTDEIWTTGEGVIYGDFKVRKPFHFLEIRTRGWNPYLKPEFQDKGFGNLNPEVKVDDHVIRFIEKRGTSLIFEFPDSIKEFTRLVLKSNTFVPSKTGLGDDARTLGLDVESIVLF